MNQLKPLLKRLLLTTHKVERSGESEPLPGPSRDLVLRVLREAEAKSAISAASLLEFMVPRFAGVAALFALIALVLQMTAKAPMYGLWSHAVTQNATILLVFTP